MARSHFVVMRRAPETVGGWCHFKDWVKSEAQGLKYCDDANGMVLALWSRDYYEQWHKDNIAPHYKGY